jgi:Mg-chelatase subunit ChlD
MTFALPYEDYRGANADNNYELTVVQEPLAGQKYMPMTVDTFTRITNETGGEVLRSKGGNGVIDTIRRALVPEKGRNVDLVLCIDTTNSMRDEMAAIKSGMATVLAETRAQVKSLRVGIVYYKDYGEEYVTRPLAFSTDLAGVQQSINAVKVGGGKDIPEAVNEALYDAATRFDWTAEDRLVLLIGDAPPHPRPRGAITADMTRNALNAAHVRVKAILLPQ